MRTILNTGQYYFLLYENEYCGIKHHRNGILKPIMWSTVNLLQFFQKPLFSGGNLMFESDLMIAVVLNGFDEKFDLEESSSI